MSKRKGQAKEKNAFHEVLVGAAISAAVLIAASVIGAAIIYMTADPLGASDICSLIALLSSAAVSGYIISKRTAHSKLLTVSLSSLLLCLLLVFIGIIVAGGELGGRIFLNYICYMGVALLFGALGAREKKHSHRHK